MARTLTAADRSALIRLASTLPAGSEERRAILAGLSKSAEPTTFPDSFRRKADKLALAVYDKTRHLSHVPQELVDMEIARLEPGTFLPDSVLEYLWRLAGGEPLFIEGYGKLDWDYLHNRVIRRDVPGWRGTNFWQAFLKEAQRKL